ncbi:MAG: hypothetical protein HY819_01760 [Acidobacteria bacterium]|nr:hypothetical protein [Acidobacteriota bacterium]
MENQKCECKGNIKNCLYCLGTGLIINEKMAEEIIEKTQVVYCPECSQQNRIYLEKFLEPPLCYKCGERLFKPKSNPFNLPPFQRKIL